MFSYGGLVLVLVLVLAVSLNFDKEEDSVWIFTEEIVKNQNKTTKGKGHVVIENFQ